MPHPTGSLACYGAASFLEAPSLQLSGVNEFEGFMRPAEKAKPSSGLAD
jgi:hypothetical protein